MKCPGQDSRYWDEAAIFESACPNCGHAVEFFKDEAKRKCRQCGQQMLNPKMDFGCATYCPYAAQCLGEVPAELAARKQELLKDRVAVEVKKRLKADFGRIARLAKVARYAESIGTRESCNLAVVLVAAYLYDLHETPEAVQNMLDGLGADEELIGQVLQLIGQPAGTGQADSVEAKVLHDAERLARLEEQKNDGAEEFLTKSGRTLADEFAARLMLAGGPF